MMASRDPTFRFDIHARLQHGMLAVSLAVLMLTGFPIKFAHAGWARTVVGLFGSFETMLAVHLVAAGLLALVVVYHLGLCLWGLVRGRLDFAVVPRLRDFSDFAHHLTYLVGLRRDPPRFGKFTWWEKFEYWAVVWGTTVMGVSGLTLAFPEWAASYVPRWVIGALRVAHSNEALLAFLAVLIGHSFAVHFSPSVFPSSPVWYNGKLKLSQLMEDHALLYHATAGCAASDLDRVPHSRWAHNRVLILVELVVYGGLVAWVFVSLVPLLLR
ncbi:MAG: cytochrome b/b6 domain-containing protein [Firmicutes bacterium]|nr:cytochrome b/b6 domain-containing protein [Bacillota bacterium]